MKLVIYGDFNYTGKIRKNHGLLENTIFHGENLANGIYNHLSRGLIFHCQVILLEGTCRRIGTIMNNPILYIYIFVSYLVIYICICILYIAEETLGG